MNFGTYAFMVAWNPGGAATAYDALPRAPLSCSIRRGRPTDLQGMSTGSCRLVLSDEARVYDPSNAASPLVAGGYLRPMRRLSVTVTPTGASGSYRQTVLNDNPSGYWRLGEASGTVASDASGYGHSGVYEGGVGAYGTTGALSGDADTAVTFNGATGDMTVTYAAAPSATAASIEAWVLVSVSAQTGVIAQTTIGGAPDTRFVLYHDQGNLRFRRSVGGAWSEVSVSDAGSTGAWMHVVGTYDGALHLYVNGAAATTTARGGVTLGGQETDPGLVRLFANVDDVATYPTALGLARVSAHYQAGVDPSGADPAASAIFTGLLTRLWANPGAVEPTVEMEFVDGFWALQHAFPVVASTGQVTAGQALSLLLSASGITSEAYKDLDQGGLLADFVADGTRSALDLAQEIELVDQGVFFYSAAGRYTYRDRTSRYGRARATPVATVSAASIATQVPGFDAANVVNKQGVQVRRRVVTANDDGTTTTTEVDLGDLQEIEETSYLGSTQAGSPIASTLLRDETQAYSLAQHVVLTKRAGDIPVQEIAVPGLTAAMVQQQVTVDLANPVTLSGVGVSGEGLVESITHEITRAQHVTTYAVTSRPGYGFTLGVSTIGGPDVIRY